MASVAEAAPLRQGNPDEDADYESDTEATGSLALALRRRRASDDEEEDEDEGAAGRSRILRPGYADDDSEGEGAPPPLEDEEEDEEEVEEEEEFEDDVIIVVEEEDVVGEEVEILRRGGPLNIVGEGADSGTGSKVGGVDDGTAAKEQSVEEKKEAEPFAVPTAGAFYMHDDRFRDNGGVRPRRSAGGRKLWESKDDRAWVHDRFEELNLQDDDEKHRRGGRGQFRGRGRGRGGRRGQGRGNRSKMYEDSSAFPFVRRGGGRGRGSRRKEADVRNAGDGPVGPSKQASKSSDTLPNNSLSRSSSQPANVHADGMNTKKNVGSSLSSASPPFYPSGTQHQSVLIPFKRDSQYGGSMRSTSVPVVTGDDEMRASSTASVTRNGKNAAAVRGQSQPQVDPALRSSAGKQINNVQQALKSTSVNFPQQQQSKVQGRNQAIGGQSTGLPVNSGQQINKGPNFTKMDSTVSQRSIQNQGQPSSRAVSQQSLRQTTDGNQSSLGPSTSEVGSTSSQPGSNKGKNSAIGRAGANPQGAGRASYGYSGTQAAPGTSGMSVSLSEQSFPHAPALLPVMQFGGQHHGGLGVPAVGMALPGYVAQPQLGFGATEMTWVPFLAGAAGALGATYCSPYITVDNSYYPQTAAQPTSFGVAGRDSDANKNKNMWKPNSRSELVNDEFGQRHNKPRRHGA